MGKRTRSITPLRREGMRIIFYLDNILMLSKNSKESRENSKQLINHLEKLGMTMNGKKCILEPTQKMEFLAMTLNSRKITISVPREKIRKVTSEMRKICKLETIPIRKLAALSGTLAVLAFGFKLCQIHQRMLQRNLSLFMNRKIPWDKKFPIFKTTKKEIYWWIRYLSRLNGVPIIEKEKYTYTDASKTGWGAVTKDLMSTSSGFWEKQYKESSSNFRELKAILMTQREGRKIKKQKSDNSLGQYNSGLPDKSTEQPQTSSLVKIDGKDMEFLHKELDKPESRIYLRSGE